MAKMAILGFGTVGSGVLEVLRTNAAQVSRRLGEALEVKAICDIRDFSGHADVGLFVKDIAPILADDEIKLVVETIGGVGVALDYVARVLASGRHVVTSNKELVAKHGAELLALAKANSVCFLFEASVGGGVPLITPLHQCLAANRIERLVGIVNGTTNFMLGRMEQTGVDLPTALAEAQALGYAETGDSADDVDGVDACRKIAILASLACGRQVHPQNILARGIRQVTPEDMRAAAELGCAVKLVAFLELGEATISIGVGPMLVRRGGLLAGVNDVYNAVVARGDLLGDVMFYGKGAGKLPTASAVVADAVDALKLGVGIHDSLCWQPAEPMEGHYLPAGRADVYMRCASEENLAALMAELPGAKRLEGLLALLAPDVELAVLPGRLAEWAGQGCAPVNVMRLWEEE